MKCSRILDAVDCTLAPMGAYTASASWGLVLAALLTALPLTRNLAAGHQIRESFRGQINKPVALNYLLHVPAGYHDAANHRTTYPLILFLHGAGERGSDPGVLSSLGPLGYAQRTPGFPMLVLAPVCPRGQAWKPDELMALLDEVQRKYRLNTNAIYLTGFSMGGAGTWATAMEYPERFAAIAPLCGRVIPLLGGNLWKTPVWIFHGREDPVVPFSQSQEMASLLQGLGNRHLKFQVLEGAGHEIWHDVYGSSKLYDWFMQHRRSAN